MTRGPAKVSIRIDGDDGVAVAQEALDLYASMVMRVAAIEAEGEEP